METVDKEINVLRHLMLWQNNLNHSYHISIYLFKTCSNYLLTFIITCLQFSVHDWFQLNMSTFSTHNLIWGHQTMVTQLSQPKFYRVLFWNILVNNFIFELCTGIPPPTPLTNIQLWWKTCAVLCLWFWVFFWKFHFPFLHIKIAHEYLGNLYVNPYVKWVKSRNYLQYS